MPAFTQRELELAVAYAQRSLQLAAQHGLLAELAEAHFSLATAGRIARNLPDAHSHAEQALVHFRRIGNRSFLAYSEYRPERDSLAAGRSCWGAGCCRIMH